MPGDIFVELDIDAFVKDLKKVENKLGKLKKELDRALPGMTQRCGAVIWETILDIMQSKKIVLTGTLWRSVHLAAPNVDHSGDFDLASRRQIKRKLAEAVLKEAFSCTTQIGTWLRYAYFVERGTRKMAARPYMLPGFEQSKDDVKKQWYEELKQFFEDELSEEKSK